MEQRFGGWRSKETVKRFGDYAALIVDRLGDRVKHWMTVNEIDNFTRRGYHAGVTAPGLKESVQVGHQCVHNALYGHGLGLQAVRASRHSDLQCGAVEDPVVTWPIYDTAEHREAALKAFREDPMNLARIYAMMTGKYSDLCLEKWGADAPEFSDEELALIGGEVDFIGVNCYGGIPVMADPGADGGYRMLTQRTIDIGVTQLSVAPKGLETVLGYLDSEFNRPPIYITENGWGEMDESCTSDGQIYDVARKEYYRLHLEVCLRALDKGIDLRGYFAWSFMDNFEWMAGHRMRFGMVRTDYVTQERTMKLSARYYQDCIKNRKVL